MLWIRVCINSTLSKLIAIHDYTTGLSIITIIFLDPASYLLTVLPHLKKDLLVVALREKSLLATFIQTMYESTQLMHHSITIPLLLQSLDIISVAVKCLPLTVITVDYLFIYSSNITNKNCTSFSLPPGLLARRAESKCFLCEYLRTFDLLFQWLLSFKLSCLLQCKVQNQLQPVMCAS